MYHCSTVTFIQTLPGLPCNHQQTNFIQTRGHVTRTKHKQIQSLIFRKRCRSLTNTIITCNDDGGKANETENNDNENTTTEYEPVEDGVELPIPENKEELSPQASWLQIEVRTWLDNEWPDSESHQIHSEIATKVSQLYLRLRSEGIHDLGTLLLGIGSALEGVDFSKAYVGPWNIANKVAELLLNRFAPERFESINKEQELQQQQERNEIDDPAWSILGEDDHQDIDDGINGSRRVASPSLADGFERYRFLQMILDGSASKALIDGAVAIAMGFEYNRNDGTWDGKNVTDTHFKKFGDIPPDILGDENDSRWSESLTYLDSQVKCKDGDDNKEEGLKVVIETLHGVELTNMQMNDENDHAFKKRVAVSKWLHLLGGF